MARQRSFDLTQAVDTAREAFRVTGYTATSVDDLLTHLQIGKASFYAAFGDKRSLFMAGLDARRVEVERFFAAALSEPTPARARIAAVLHSIAAMLLAEEPVCGCLLTNTATELGASDDDAAAKVSALFVTVSDLFERAIRDGQATGDIAPEKDARALGQFFLAVLQGMQVVAKVAREPHVLDATITSALLVLDGGSLPERGSAMPVKRARVAKPEPIPKQAKNKPGRGRSRP